jgi:hypothetical protein
MNTSVEMNESKPHSAVVLNGTVPNGTVLNGTSLIEEVMSEKTINYVSRYKDLVAKGAKAVIDMCLLLQETKKSLNSIEFGHFCKEVGLERDGSTSRKLLTIADKATRFQPYLESLPSAWTTLYQLSILENKQFDDLAKSNALSPYTTSGDISELLNGKKDVSAPSPIIKIDLERCNAQQSKEIWYEVDAIHKKHGNCFELKANATLETFIKSLSENENSEVDGDVYV